MINRWKKLEDLLRETEFVVEASSFEQQALWERYSSEAGHNVKWEEQTRGFVEQVGELDSRPVNITIFGCLLNGHPILFYDAVSQVVDWAMIENWFKEHCWPKRDNGTRRAHCDALNFHHCLEVAHK